MVLKATATCLIVSYMIFYLFVKASQNFRIYFLTVLKKYNRNRNLTRVRRAISLRYSVVKRVRALLPIAGHCTCQWLDHSARSEGVAGLGAVIQPLLVTVVFLSQPVPCPG